MFYALWVAPTHVKSLHVEGSRGGSMELKLTDEELDFLLNFLEQHHRELLNEIAHTDSREFKQGLRRNEQLLDSLICRMEAAALRETHG